jgi:hypothetical protein
LLATLVDIPLPEGRAAKLARERLLPMSGMAEVLTFDLGC